MNWLADRQRILNEKKDLPLPQQITSISTTAEQSKKSKKDDEKIEKKRKKKRYVIYDKDFILHINFI